MLNEIIVDSRSDITRVALLEDRELVEIYIEKASHERLAGNIYRGKVTSVLPGMQAAFIDIGYEKNAFLYVGDAFGQRDSSGQKEYAVQKEHFHKKDYAEQDEDTSKNIDTDIVTNVYAGTDTDVDACTDTDGDACNDADGDTGTDADVETDTYADRAAFPDIRGYNIDELLRPGQEITVQVVKEPIGTKGPRVTTHITLPGRHLVLLPYANYTGVSRRIENENERTKLKKIAEKIKPEGMGLIVRTASEGKEAEDFSSDLKFLLKLWEKIKHNEVSGSVPRCLHKDLNLVYRTVRDLFTWDIDKFRINDRQQYLKVLEIVDMISPALKLRVEYFSNNYGLFEYYQIESRISKALARRVWLKCGGYIVIDPTEALTVIDVNTGKYTGDNNLEETVLKTNTEAAREIAKQLRLRDIGGIIIIDFIDMHQQEHKLAVLNTLKQALKKDRTKSAVIGMTGLGLIEMTRKKMRQGLSSVMCIDCSCCGGTGKLPAPEFAALKIENEHF